MNSGAESRLLLRIHYDGSGFLGWQSQPEGRTVQDTLEAAVERLTEVPLRVIGAGRTDRGVHATGQAAAVTVPARWSPQEFRRAMNAVLPADVWIESSTVVAHDFHPRYDAVARTYEYRLGTSPGTASPFHRRFCWAFGIPVPLEPLRHSAETVRGRHSFGSFAKAGQEHLGDICTVSSAEWTEWDGLGVKLRITANRFLHRMVRYLVGTMVDIARSRRPESDLAEMLSGKETRLVTSPPAPSGGLVLAHVAYPEVEQPSNETPTAPSEVAVGPSPGDRRDP